MLQLDCQEIADEIEAELDFLTSETRNIPDRHRSMRAIFSYSWEKLTEQEQNVLQKLSVFRGGFERIAAKAVAGAFLSLLARLVGKSLLSIGENGRYSIHELLRQFAAEKLSAASNEENIQAIHGRYFLTFLAEQDPKLRGKDGLSVLQAIEDDFDNVRIAIYWAVQNNHLLFNRLICIVLWAFFEFKGWFKEGETVFQLIATRLKADCGPITPDDLPATISDICLSWAQYNMFEGAFQTRMGRLQEAEATIQHSLSILPSNDPSVRWTKGLCLLFLGVTVSFKGEFNRSSPLIEESRALLQAEEDLLLYSVALLSQEQAARICGDYQESEHLLNELEVIQNDTGAPWLHGYILSDRGRLATAYGDLAQAERYHEAALAYRSQVGTYTGVVFTLWDLGVVTRLQGNYEKAQTYLRQSITVSNEINLIYHANQSKWELGNLAVAMGKFDLAKSYFQESGVPGSLWHLIGGPGWVALGVGDNINAQKLFQARLQEMLSRGIKPIGLDALVGVAHLQARASEFSQALSLLALVQHHPASSFELKEKVRMVWDELTAELPAELIEKAKARSRELDLFETAEALVAEAGTT